MRAAITGGRLTTSPKICRRFVLIGQNCRPTAHPTRPFIPCSRATPGSRRKLTGASVGRSLAVPINALAVGDKLPPATFITDRDKKEVTTEELCKGGSSLISH